MSRDQSRAVPRRLRKLRVYRPHQRDIERRLAGRPVVERGRAGRHLLALTLRGQTRMVRIDHLWSQVHALRPKAFAKKPFHQRLTAPGVQPPNLDLGRFRRLLRRLAPREHHRRACRRLLLPFPRHRLASACSLPSCAAVSLPCNGSRATFVL